MDDCPHGQQKRTCEICELAAERDWLRTAVDTYKSVFIETEDRLRAELASVTEERDRLRAVVDAVRVMWDNIVGTADEAVMGFPVADYNDIEAALDQLDGSAEATDG